MWFGRTSPVSAIVVFVALVALLGGHSLGHGGRHAGSRHDAGMHGSLERTHGTHVADGAPGATRDGATTDRGSAAVAAAACGFALAILVGSARRSARSVRVLLWHASRVAQVALTPEPPIPKLRLAA